MRRRDFITLVGGAAAWPFSTAAQQSSLPVIGILDDTSSQWVDAFRQGLNDGGLIEGRDVTTDLRSTVQYPELRLLADQLVQRRVALIAALGGVPAKVAKAATATIPIVFVAVIRWKWGLFQTLIIPAGTSLEPPSSPHNCCRRRSHRGYPPGWGFSP